MRKTSLIGHVVELHEAIRHVPRPADTTVQDYLRARHYLGARDRRFITDAVYEILRNQILLQVYVEAAHRPSGASAPNRPVPSLALYIAYAAKILREKSELILSDVIALARVYLPEFDCAAFVQALQTVDLPGEVIRDPVRNLAIRHSIPEFIAEEWLRRYGEEEAGRLCESLNHPAPITLRVNTLKASVEECRHALALEGVQTQRTALSPFGLVLVKRVNVHGLRTFRDGLFEMQDEGSQLLSLLLSPRPDDHVVDACAGGGGKTLHLGALMENRGEILAIDLEERRLQNLRERVRRAGITIVNARLAGRDDPSVLSWAGRADRVLIDAPCTGTGTIRRNPSLKLSVTGAMVEQYSSTQRSVLDRYAGLVRAGGRLVYATCSLLEKENENVVAWFLETHGEFTLVPAGTVLSELGIAIETNSPFLTLLPHRHSTDGFFAAVMTRRT